MKPETNSYKTISGLLRNRENSVVAVACGVYVLKLVNQANINEVVDRVKEITHASHADGAVNVSLFVSYADLHSLHADGFFGASVQAELTRDLAIELRYLFADDEGTYHCVTPLEVIYVVKYLRSVSA